MTYTEAKAKLLEVENGMTEGILDVYYGAEIIKNDNGYDVRLMSNNPRLPFVDFHRMNGSKTLTFIFDDSPDGEFDRYVETCYYDTKTFRVINRDFYHHK